MTATPAAPAPPVAEIKNDPSDLQPDKEVKLNFKDVALDERTIKIMGATCLLIGMFLFVSFLSYVFTWREDQDKVFAFNFQFFAARASGIKNVAGYLGAYFSHLFIYEGFGLSAFLFTSIFFIIGINAMVGRKVFSMARNLRYLLVGLFVCSVTFSFVFRSTAFSWGGGVGNLLRDMLINWLGNFGTGALLMASFFSYTIWRFNPTFHWPDFKAMMRKKASETVADDGVFDTDLEEEPMAAQVVAQQKTAPHSVEPIEPTEPENEIETVVPNIPRQPEKPLPQFGNKLKGSKEADFSPVLEINQPANPLNEFGVTEIPMEVFAPQDPEENLPEFKAGEGKLYIDEQARRNVAQPPLTVPPSLPTSPALVENKPALDPLQENTIEWEPPLSVAANQRAKMPKIPTDESLALEIRQPIIENEHVSVIMPFPVQENTDALETEKEEAPLPHPLEFLPTIERPLEVSVQSKIIETVPVEVMVPVAAAPADTFVPHQGLDTHYDSTLDLSNYRNPTTDMLEMHGSDKITHDPEELEANKNQIVATLKDFDITIKRISATVGPTVTLYEIVPAPGVKISRIKNLEDDIALSLAALGIRIIAPIPGKGTIGIEVPNVKKKVVSMRTLLMSDKFQNTAFSLPIAIGKKIDNENFIVDLATMPHLLMAGATGQGKSVGINTLLVSLLFKKHPSQLKFVLVDPKKVELSLYKTIEKHFLAKLPGEEESIITDTKKVVNTLNALCIEMDNRYDLLKEAGCRNIKEYNEKFQARRLNPQKGHQFLPFIVLVVDEFADLIMTAGKEVEMPIARLAQLARAIGIHLIIATQRPSVNIITGTIKANFPARIAFKVSSKIDSRTILDTGGAEQLIGKGDMLISYNGELTRLQCAFVDTPEVERVCEFIGEQLGYPDAFLLPEYVDEKDAEAKGDFDQNEKDPLFEDAARLIVQNQLGSTSLIQRRMKLGYNRAGRLMDQLERAGVVGPNLGSKAREVIYKTEAELEEFLNFL